MGALKYWLWLTQLGKVTGAHAYTLLRHFGGPEAAYAADDGAYTLVPNLPPSIHANLKNKSLVRAEKILADCERLKLRVLTINDTEYPERLRQISDPPCVLYLKGQLPQMDDEVVVSVVGARESSPYGELAGRRFSMELARQGAVIVSGIARGIDGAALTGALQGGGKVVSVLGNGIDVTYPQSNRDLYEDIPSFGALLSEYPPGTKPEGSYFPVRNRIISGLSLGVLLVEGGARSGSLITARLALEQNRDVFAVPGNWDAPMSLAPNLLIQRGEAKLVLGAWDILEEYQYSYPHKIHPRPPLSPKNVEPSQKKVLQTPKREPEEEAVEAMVLDLTREPEALTDDECALLRSLEGKICTADEIIAETELPAKRILSALTMLQVRGLVIEEAGKRFRTPVIIKGYDSQGTGQTAQPGP